MSEEKARIERMTNAELWKALLDASEAEQSFNALKAGAERRLRRIGFLPPLPVREQA